MKTKSEYVREVTARYIGPRRRRGAVKDPAIAADFMRDLLRDDAREHFFALYLNGAHEFVSYSLIVLGTANFASVHPREIFQGAVLVGSCAFIIGHNLCGAPHKLCYVECSFMWSMCVPAFYKFRLSKDSGLNIGH